MASSSTEEQKLPVIELDPSLLNKPQSLAGKLAVVTGASRGIGQAITLALASRGCSILGLYLNETSTLLTVLLRSKISDHFPNSTTYFIRENLSSPPTPSAVLTALTTFFPDKKVDIIVNNAADTAISSVADITRSSLESTFATNLVGPIMLLQALLPVLSRTGSGRIINISSEASHLGRARSSAYSASKSGLEALGRVWAKELGKEYNGLTANNLILGLVDTDLWAALSEERQKPWLEKVREENAIAGRVGKPKEVAEVVAWLCGEEASWVSGQSLGVTGGGFMIT